jgi:hypothetical protein
MRITSTGNVGIGTSLPAERLDVNGGAKIVSNLVLGTSSNWTFAGGWRGIKVSDRHALQATPSANSIVLSSNAAIGASGWEYTVSAAAGNYTQSAGIHIFNRAPVGTDGDAVTFEESMRITSTGNVGINESAPDYRLDVNGTFGFTPGASVTPVDNGDVVFELTNNTTLTVKAKGSDGVVRSGTILLV